MTAYFLQIKLLSPLTSTAGEGRVGLVDRDIAFDDFGLPILLGRRLKGLWREAYRDIVDAWQQCGEAHTSVDKIFGKVGQKPNDGSAYFHIGTAELENASSLKKWLKYLQYRDDREKESKILVDDVVNHYATVRAQTAIDRHSGSAKENTLRLTRALKSGWIFWAPVRFTDTPNAELQNALALGAVALRHMGTARTRGLGKVRCRLLKLDNGNMEDLTPDLTQSSLPSIAGAATNCLAQQSSVQTPSNTSSNQCTPTRVLRYRLTLKEPTVIPVADGDPNTVVTRQDIPGSHLWGAAAWHYLRDAKHSPTDGAFRHAFLDGGLRFLTAYPEVHDREEHNEPDQRTIPIPHSVREFKKMNAPLVDFTESLNSEQKKHPKRRIGRRYARVWTGNLETTIVNTEFHYHHARASNDRRLGRALGAEVPNGGALFKYEAIQANQCFQGAVLGTEDDLSNLKTWLADVDSIRLGRSRSAQYGNADFEWVDNNPRDLSGHVEWKGFIDTSNSADTPPLLPDNRLIITTLSPVLTVNDNGHPNVGFPIREVVHLLDLDTDDGLELTASYARTEMISGYHTHLRLPRQQRPAIAAGSVFEFQLKQELSENGKEGLMKLEQDGIGLRKGEGYGRIAVNRQRDLNLTGNYEVSFDEKRPEKPTENVPQEIQNLLQDMAEKHCVSTMQQYAREIAEDMPKNKIPNNSLLGRLRLFIQKDSLVANLNELHGKPAEEKLTNYRIDTRELTMFVLPDQPTLYDLFMAAGKNSNDLTERLIKDKVDMLAADCDEDTRTTMVNTLLENESWRLCKDFLNYLITALRRKSRT